MNKSIKTILNDTLAQSGFLERGSFFNSSDKDDKQMTAIANRVGIEIMDFTTWPQMRKTFSLNYVPGRTLYTLPDDFRSLVPDSAWEVDGTKRMQWPVPDGMWFMYKFSAFSAGGMARVKMTVSNQIEIINDDQEESYTFDYISSGYAEAGTNNGALPPTAPKSSFTEDTDTWVLDDQLLTLGIQAHWQQAKGMPGYQEHYSNYMNKMREAVGRANGSMTVGGGDRGTGRGAPYYSLWRPA